MNNKLVTLKTFRFLPEAEAHRMFLESEGLRVFLADAEIVNMDWMLGNAVGNIKLQVPESEAQRALELLEHMPVLNSDDLAEPSCADKSTCLSCGAPMSEQQTVCPACGWTFEDRAE